MQEVYYLIVSGYTDRDPIKFTEKPTQEQITKAIKEKKGTSARIEIRYELDDIESSIK